VPGTNVIMTFRTTYLAGRCPWWAHDGHRPARCVVL